MLWRDIYGSFLDWAAASGRAFYPFAYDWRRDPLESVARFIASAAEVSRQHDGSKIQTVAHSMGGLISFVALNRRPNLFHSMLFAGVPFGSGISFLEDMHVDTATGLNRRILSPKVLFTFVSRFCLFPSPGMVSGLEDQDGNSIPHDWYSAEDWERRKLGVFSLEEPKIVDGHRAHLRNALARAREFRSLLVSKNDSFRYPPIAVLASDTRRTLLTVVKGGPGQVRGWDFRTAPKQPGDGRVLFAASVPPEGVRHVVYKTDRQHGDLLSDTDQVSTILEHLVSR